MGHLTNPISYRLGKKIWWRDEYLTWSKSSHLFYSMRSFLDRFLSSFFGRVNRFEYQGIFYFGSKLLIGRKVYLYIFLQDQKAQRFLYRRRFFQRKRKKKVYKILTRKKERLLKDIKKGCRKFIANISKFSKISKWKRKGSWFWRRKRTMRYILRFLIRVWRFEGGFVKKRFLESLKFRRFYFRTKSFHKTLLSLICRRRRRYRVRRLMKFFFRYFSLKGTIYKVLERYFRDKKKIEIFFLSLRTKQKKNPLTTMILTPKLLGEFITRKLAQRHRLRDILFPIMRSLGKNESVSGFKISCSGRFTRADRALYTWYRYGKISLNTVSRPILYDFTEKSLKFGMVSIKIWIQYNGKVLKEMKRRELLEIR